MAIPSGKEEERKKMRSHYICIYRKINTQRERERKGKKNPEKSLFSNSEYIVIGKKTKRPILVLLLCSNSVYSIIIPFDI
jgi:hypothetical protein